MRKLVGLLALTTLLFASTTAWLAYRLQVRSIPAAAVAAESKPVARPFAARRPDGDDTTKAVLEHAAANPGAKTSSATSTTAARPAGNPSAADKNREVMLPIARNFLARFDDPVQHVAQVAETRAGLKRQYDPLRQKLKLDAATYNQIRNQIAVRKLGVVPKKFQKYH